MGLSNLSMRRPARRTALRAAIGVTLIAAIALALWVQKNYVDTPVPNGYSLMLPSASPIVIPTHTLGTPPFDVNRDFWLSIP